MLLKRRHTLKRSYEFSFVRQRGVSKPGRFLVLSLAPIPKEEEARFSRFGIIVTKRVGCAVERNRLRRLIREILRAHAYPIEQGHYVVIIMRKSAKDTTYEEIEKDYLKCQGRVLRALPKGV